MTAAQIILVLVTLQRLSELVIARRNTAALMAWGGQEIGAAHYPVMVLLHASWLLGLWYFGWNQPVNYLLLRPVSRAAAAARVDSCFARAALDNADHCGAR